ncbi:MAG: hypothetical protein HC881_18050 [Leptolyngbyaceae cyanobacterium SL_7_1]|nr:hypothetical protein [Leptolyngbyaceae cyanobacterium SL_7_1]
MDRFLRSASEVCPLIAVETRHAASQRTLCCHKINLGNGVGSDSIENRQDFTTPL